MNIEKYREFCRMTGREVNPDIEKVFLDIEEQEFVNKIAESWSTTAKDLSEISLFPWGPEKK
jgi:hypothetical protein